MVAGDVGWLYEEVSGLNNHIEMLKKRNGLTSKDKENIKMLENRMSRSLSELAEKSNFNTVALKRIVEMRLPGKAVVQRLEKTAADKLHWNAAEEQLTKVSYSHPNARKRKEQVERAVWSSPGNFIGYNTKTREGKKRQKVFRTALRERAGIPRAGRR
jgi:hypothetical protein